MNLFEIWQVVLGCLQVVILVATFLGALFIGVKTNQINERLRLLQDYVGVAVVPADENILKLLNVGKVNLYLYGFEIPGNNRYFERARLLATGTGDSAYYWIETPNINNIENNKFDIKLYLVDEFGNKWISEFGGSLKGDRITVWTYKTYKSVWTLDAKEKE